MYEVMVPDSLSEMFAGEEGHFHCPTPALCHIEGAAEEEHE
jgi:hypothetical protein